MRWLIGLLLLFPLSAWAQNSVPKVPTVTNGYGTLSVSNSSIALSTVTATTGTYPQPTNYPNGNLVVYNEVTSAGTVYVCMLGGVCTSGNGWPVTAGSVLTFNVGGTLTSPTIIAATTATVMVGW